MLKHNITIINEVKQLENLTLELESLAEEWDIPMAISLNLNLVLEELVTNIIFYGYDDKDVHEINIQLSIADQVIQLQIEDDGREFNPLLLAEPKIDDSIEDRKIGGLGIFFVRKIMDHITYERTNNNNILTLTKKIT